MNYRKNLLAQIKLEEKNIERQELELSQSKSYLIQSSKNHHLFAIAAVLLPSLLVLKKLTKKLPFPRSKLKSLVRFVFYTGLKRSLRKFL